jgi:hypothetical protein
MLKLPSQIKSIQEYAFGDCNNLDSLIIPYSIDSIGQEAFSFCSNLKSIYSKSGIPPDLTNSPGVFYYVNNARCNLYVPFGSKILYEVTYQWEDFENIIEVSGFSLLSREAFVDAESNSSDSITLNSNVEWVANSDKSWLSVTPVSGISNDTLVFIADANPNTFQREASVTVSATGFETETIRITQREAIQIIDMNAGQLSVLLNDSLKNALTRLKIIGEIDARDFKTMRDSMPKISDIDLSEAAIKSYSGYLGTSYNSGSHDYPSNVIPESALGTNNFWEYTSKINTIKLPFNIVGIGNYAFYNCDNLIDFNFPKALKAIGNFAFLRCNKLESIVLPSEIDTIGIYAFYRCLGLKSIELPDNLKKIFSCTFTNCSSLTYVKLPDSLISIGEKAFSSCSALTSITIPTFVEFIGIAAFHDCIRLDSIILPASIRSLGADAFSNCENLKSAIIPDSLTTLEANTFNYCINLASVKLPDSLKTIGKGAFSLCRSLSTFDIPSRVEIIEEKAFEECISLDSIILPINLKRLGTEAFAGCQSLKSITIPNSLTTIEAGSFGSCSNLASAMLPDSLESIGARAFSNCSKLVSLKLPDSLKSIGASAFNNCSRLFSLKLPYQLNSIGWGAFSNCSGLDGTITIPSAIEIIEEFTFMDCSNIDSLIISNSLTTIDASAFNNCNSIVYVKLSDSLKFIGVGAFASCSGLDKLIIPSSVNFIGAYAFAVCSTLKTIYSESSVPVDLSSSTDVFYSVDYTTCILNVPYGSKEAYQTANQWQDFENIVEMPGISLSTDTINIAAAWGSSDSVIISSNTTWAAASDQTWLTVTPATGTGNDTLIFTAKSNPTTSIRSAYITISGDSIESDTITVIQDAGTGTTLPFFTEVTDTIISNSEIACFNAYDTIFVAGTDTVEFLNGSTVDLIAGQAIFLLPGFHAFEGSLTHAYITTSGTFCGGVSGIISADQPSEKSKTEKALPEKPNIVAEEKSVKVYPNPNNGQFTLELTNIESGATVDIYNMLGARVYQSTTTNGVRHKINLPGIKKGIYFVKIMDGKKQFTRKMIVNK